MNMIKKLAAAAAVSFALGAHAAPADALPTTGTLVVVPAYGEVKHANDQAIVLLAIEETDKDKAAAASRVNTKMKQGADIVKKEDPQASLKTQGYYTYPVYPEEIVLNNGRAAKQPRVPTAWRVGQYLEVTTTNLDKLPKTVAATQKILTLNSINFGLTSETTKKLDDQRIAATYKNLNERIASIANAMGRKVGDAVIDTIDFEGSGNYTQREQAFAAAPMAMRMKTADAVDVAEPSFEPGETTLQMQLVGKVRFK
jgi:uncharacterized protein YggE